MKKELIRAHIKFTHRLIGTDGLICLIGGILLMIINISTHNIDPLLMLIPVMYAAIKYQINWNHDNLLGVINKNEKQKR